MNTREIKDKFISAIGKIARKSKPTAQQLSQRRYFYLARMAALQAQDRDTQSILIALFEDYMGEHACAANSKLASDLVNLANDWPADPSSKNYVFSVIHVLNARYQELEEDDLSILLSVFFSLYESYRLHLNDEIKNKLEIIDVYSNFFSNELKSMVATHKHARLCNKRVPENFSETDLMKELDQQILTSLLHNVTHKDSRVRTRAREMLVLGKKKINKSGSSLVTEKLLHLMRSKSRDARYSACVLLPEFFHFFSKEEQIKIINFFYKMIKDDDFLQAGGSALIKVVKQKVEIDVVKVVTDLLEKIKINKYVSYKAFDILLRLREHISTPLPEFAVDALSEYLSGHHPKFRLSQLKNYWNWLTEEEKEKITDSLFEHYESDDVEHKNQILKHIIELGPNWVPSKKHRPVFSRLFECLQEETQRETAIQALSKSCTHIPLEDQAVFVDYLLIFIQKLNEPEAAYHTRIFCHAIMALTKMSAAIPENQRRWVVENSFPLLRSANTAIETWACKAVANLVNIVPIDLHAQLAAMLIEKLNWYHHFEKLDNHIYTSSAADEAAKALCHLETVLEEEEKKNIAAQLFKIICDSKAAMAGRLAAIKAFSPYINSLACHEKSAFLNRLMNLENRTNEHLTLFLHIHKSYRAEMEASFLDRAITVADEDLGIYVPPELISHIRTFMR